MNEQQKLQLGFERLDALEPAERQRMWDALSEGRRQARLQRE